MLRQFHFGEFIMNKVNQPRLGDVYRCDLCKFEVRVTAGCNCETKCANLECCGQPMTNVTSPTRQEAPFVEEGDPFSDSPTTDHIRK